MDRDGSTITVRSDRRILGLDASAQRALGYCESDLKGVPLDHLVTKPFGPPYSDVVQRFLDSDRQTQQDDYVSIRRRDGSELLATISLRKEARDGQLVAALVVCPVEVGPGELVRHCASLDAVTGLPNRHALLEALGRQVAQRDRRPFALILVALAGFKDQVVSLGFTSADQILQECAYRIRTACGPNALVAHLDGHRFAVLPDPAVHPVRDSEMFARCLVRHLEEPVALANSEPVVVEPLVGIACVPVHGSDPERLVLSAEVAADAARECGTSIAVFDPERDGMVPDRFQVLRGLRRGLVEDALELHFQPIVNLEDGSLARAEALLRWPGAHVGPDVFIPLAERSGLIRQIDQWVLRTAIRQAAAWTGNGVMCPVSVNLSARTFQDSELADRVAALLSESRVSPSRLHLEITETAFMTSPDVAEEVSHRLRQQGIQISLDDFGAGYSPLVYLQRMGVSALKIDRSFITNLPGNNETETIVEAIVDLGHRLDLELVAEGIEDRGTLQQLRSMGCEYGQGNFFSPAVPADDLFTLDQRAAA